MPSLYNINASSPTLSKAAESQSKQVAAAGTPLLAPVTLCLKQSPFSASSNLSSSKVLTTAAISFSSKLAMY
ncbi:unnamed protein product [Prunus armeniaca]